eukprot:403371979
MERKQEANYADPFDLLKNMQDVMQIYDKPAGDQQNTNVKDKLTGQQQEKSIDDQSTNHTSRQSTKPFRFTNQSFYQNTVKTTSNNFYQNSYANTGTKSKKNILNRSHFLNQSLDENRVTTAQTINNSNQQNNQTFTSEYKNNEELQHNMQLPSIMKKQRTLNQYNINSTGMRSTKTIFQKKEERLLDLSNIPQIAQNAEPDALQIRYEKIKKLREEFNDIKTQFKIPEPQYFNPNQINNQSTLYSKRQNLQSRDSISNQNQTCSIAPSSVHKDLSKSDLKQTKLSQIKEFISEPNKNVRQRPMTSANIPINRIREIRQAKMHQVKNENKEMCRNMTSPASNQDLNPKKFVNQSAQRILRNQNEQNQQSKDSKLKTVRRRRLIQEPQIIDEAKLMEKMGSSAIMALTNSAQKNNSDSLTTFRLGERRFSNQNENTQYNEMQDKSLNLHKQDALGSLSVSVDMTLNQRQNYKNEYEHKQQFSIGDMVKPVQGGFLGLRQLSLVKNPQDQELTLRLKDNSFANIDSQQTIDFPQFQDSSNAQMHKPNNSEYSFLLKNPQIIASQRNENLEYLAISSRSYQQPTQDLEVEKQKFSTIGAISDQQFEFFDKNNATEEKLNQKHSTLMRTRNLESIEEENTSKQVNKTKKKSQINALPRKASQIIEDHSSQYNLKNDVMIYLDEDVNKSQLQPNQQTQLEEMTTKSPTDQRPKQHAGVSLYEQYKINQQKQMQLLQKKKKKELKKLKKLQKIDVESVYMREAILALIHSQGSNLNPLKMRQGSQGQKNRKQSNAGVNEQQRTTSSLNKRSKSQMQKRAKKQKEINQDEQYAQQQFNEPNDYDYKIPKEYHIYQNTTSNTLPYNKSIPTSLNDTGNFIIKNSDENKGEDKSDCLVQSLTQQHSTQIIQNYKQNNQIVNQNSNDRYNCNDNFIHDL